MKKTGTHTLANPYTYINDNMEQIIYGTNQSLF